LTCFDRDQEPVGIKIAGPDLKVIEKLGEQVEAIVKQVPGRAPPMLNVFRVDVTSK